MRGQSPARIIDDLNPVLRGWYGYFQHAHPNTFFAEAGLFALHTAWHTARHPR